MSSGAPTAEGDAALGVLDLPAAPPVTRAAPVAFTRPALPAVVLLVLGAVLILGPLAGGTFSQVAAGKQLIDRFEPYLTPDALARYDADLGVLRGAASGVDDVYRTQRIAQDRFPGLDAYRVSSSTIDERASSLLRTVAAARADYRRVADVGGFDRVPFLLVLLGAVAVYGGLVLRYGSRQRARPAAALVCVVAALVAAYPFVSGFDDGASAGRRMLTSLAPVMTTEQVRLLQGDFIVLVTAVGELDTSFRRVPEPGAAATRIDTLVRRWPAVSADLASLVGAINDNVPNFQDLQSLDDLTSGVGVSGLRAFPWILVGLGAVTATLSVAALSRRRKVLT